MSSKTEMSIGEAVTCVGKRIYGAKWKEPNWEFIHRPADGSVLNKGSGSAKHSQQNLNGEYIVSVFQDHLYQGALSAYVKNNKLKHNIPTIVWRGRMGLQLIELEAIPEQLVSSHRALRPGKIFVDRRDVLEVLLADINDVEKGVSGRKVKFPYGKITAVLCAILENERVPESQDRLCTKLLGVYHKVFPLEDLPSPESVKNEILRPFYSNRTAVKKIIINKD